MKKEYILIYFSEDGDTPNIEHHTKEEVIKIINQMNKDYDGNAKFAESGKDIEGSYFSGTVIIKGEIVNPNPIKIIESFDIE